MQARVARFCKLQTYQRQNFEAHGIPAGAVEKITARRVYPVMAPADYQGRSAGAPVKDMISVPRGENRSFRNVSGETARLLVMIVPESDEQNDPISYAGSLAKEIESDYGKGALEGLQKIGFKFEDEPAS
jgi:hypothetical protein